jgi:competence protein ComGC
LARSLAAALTKIVVMIAIVSLLILVLLPAALTAQGSGG